MSIIIRDYRDSDRSALEASIRELQEYLAAMDAEHVTRSGKDFDASAYAQILLDKVRTQEGVIFLAESDGKIVGMISGTIPPAEDPIDDVEMYPIRSGYIHDLMVTESMRGSGVGKLLMERMEQYFTEKKCDFARVGCFAPNTNTHAFYNRCGFEDRLIMLLKKL